MSHSSRRSLTVDDARAIILSSIEPLGAVRIPISLARGRVLADPITALVDSPRFLTAAMDGFAARYSDIAGATPEQPVVLPIGRSISAGGATEFVLEPGAAVRVMTGARCPGGADLIVPFEKIDEHVADGQSTISIRCVVPDGANLRAVGEDFRAGQELVSAENQLTPARLSLIAGSGVSDVLARAQPRVALITTGDELVPPGGPLNDSQIWDTNQVLVGGLIEQFGGIVVVQAQSADDVKALSDSLDQALAAAVDLIVTVGGASKGDRDVLSDLAGSETDIELWNVLMKPGRPLAFGRISVVPLIGLPGNPAAAFVSAFQFVRPAIRKLQGCAVVDTPTVQARIVDRIENAGERRSFVRVSLSTVDGAQVASLAGRQNSANLLTIARTDGLLVVPEDQVVVEPGAMMTVQLTN